MNSYTPKAHIAGIDGCHGGWLCIEEIDATVTGRVFKTFNELLDGLTTAAIIAIDVPIGLSESGQRQCDKAARDLLGRPRASSVFSAPIRSVISIKDYHTACETHRKIDGRALSKQSFAILPKIDEVDAVLSAKPSLQQRVREVHPEVCFAIWNNYKPMLYKKSKPDGRAERECLIDGEWPACRSKILAEMSGADFKRDDLNDAFAALWTARRVLSGSARVLGPQTEDRNGLRMEMWA